jgi:Nucleotidyltransferase domain
VKVIKEQRMNEANEASATLLQLAQQHADIYAPLPGVQAIVVTGSVAGGYADHYSDIDMLIYYDELLPEDAMAAACERAGGSNWGLYGRDENGSAEYYYVNGVKCEFAHATAKSWEQIIRSLFEKNCAINKKHGQHFLGRASTTQVLIHMLYLAL